MDIAGVADLRLRIGEELKFINGKASANAKLGVHVKKLPRDSPPMHAAEFTVPLLMVHGDHDAQVQFEQSEVMDKALTQAGKPHRFVRVPGADHSMNATGDRVTLLKQLEAFRHDNLHGATP